MGMRTDWRCWVDMGLGSVLGLILIVLGNGPAASSQPPVVCPAVADAIESITQHPQFRRARWGVLIQTVGAQPQTLYAYDAANYFIPASNAKLLTTAAVLSQLGPDFRIRTSIYQVPRSDGRVILQVVGRGDPSFSDADLEQLAYQIRSRGITRIDQLVADDRYFQGDPVHPNWEWEDIQAGYGAPVNSLILNQNWIGLTLIPQSLGQPLRVVWDDPETGRGWRMINRSTTVAATEPEFVQVGRDLTESIAYITGQLRVGSAAEPVAVSIPRPTEHFLERLQRALASQQVAVVQATVTPDPPPFSIPANSIEIAAVESPPLADLLMETNQQSNNLYAEALLRILGIQVAEAPKPSSLEAGITAVQRTLGTLGVEPSSYQLADGSGLSRHNQISPEALVATLQAMAQHPDASVYRASLSVAGISGTLRHRLQNSRVQGSLQGKTGALRSVATLSGYLERSDASTLVFSLMANHFETSLASVQQAMDQIIEWLAASSC